MHLNDLIDKQLLNDMLAEKYIRVQRHPRHPCSIYNYTEKTQYEGVWNQATMHCRGLIINDDSQHIIARPFKKFFNYGDPMTGELPEASAISVTDKMDGSLGIIYPTPYGGYAVATRGSFTSDPALHATEVLRQRYYDFIDPIGFTALVEIIYPTNRIVLDYKDIDDLFLIGWVGIRTGEIYSADTFEWPGRTVQEFYVNSFAKALSLPPRENAEGIVVRFQETNQLVKIKQDDYVALHRVITNTSARTLWEYLAVNACKDLIPEDKPKHWGSKLRIDPERARQILEVGPDWLEKILVNVPDEFYKWVHDTIATLTTQVEQLASQLYNDLAFAKRGAETRKDFAANIKKHSHAGALWLLYDDCDITTYLWEAVYPSPELPFKRTEDVA